MFKLRLINFQQVSTDIRKTNEFGYSNTVRWAERDIAVPKSKFTIGTFFKRVSRVKLKPETYKCTKDMYCSLYILILSKFSV